MPDTITSTRAVTPRLRPVIDCRPPAASWQRPAPRAVAQPMLVCAPDGEAPAQQAGKVVVLRNRWSAQPAANLPDPTRWSLSLAAALLEVLHGHRPVGQLSRWVSEPVLGSMSMQVRRRRRRDGEPAGARHRPVLHSLRIQFPTPRAAEVSAHLLTEARSVAMAFRIEACGARWLCTALELGADD